MICDSLFSFGFCSKQNIQHCAFSFAAYVVCLGSGRGRTAGGDENITGHCPVLAVRFHGMLSCEINCILRRANISYFT